MSSDLDSMGVLDHRAMVTFDLVHLELRRERPPARSGTAVVRLDHGEGKLGGLGVVSAQRPGADVADGLVLGDRSGRPTSRAQHCDSDAGLDRGAA